MAALTLELYRLPEVTLHVARAGEKTGETLLLLHGFPEYWFGWHKQLSFFAAQGYDVVAPDQRGYNLSSKPAQVAAYTLEKLTADIVYLIKQLGKEKVVLVGHDWGGVVAWAIAMHFPEMLHQLVILNMPHPAVLLKHLKSNPKQLLRSWYTAAFQLPVLPEWTLKALNYRLLKKAMTGTARPGTFTDEEIATYQAAWQQPGALTGMLHWYRAFKHTKLHLNLDVSVPTFMLWGKKDTALGAEMAAPSIARCVNGKLVFLEEATHWLHHEQPDIVNQEILNFIRRG